MRDNYIYLVQKERLQLLRTQHIKITQGSYFSMPKKYVIPYEHAGSMRNVSDRLRSY